MLPLELGKYKIVVSVVWEYGQNAHFILYSEMFTEGTLELLFIVFFRLACESIARLGGH